MQGIDAIFSIAILIMSVVVHEVSHGYAASLLGDQTARYEGRLTLNPLKHLDLFGSVIVPILTSLSGFTFGWAKPVPYNPYNLRNPRSGELLVALAGPISNIALAVVFGQVLRFGATSGFLSLPFLQIITLIVVVNLVLAIFNLVPIPPLDGSKLLYALLPFPQGLKVKYFLDRYGIILVFALAFLFWDALAPVIYYLFSLITGLSP